MWLITKQVYKEEIYIYKKNKFSGFQKLLGFKSGVEKTQKQIKYFA